MSNDEWTFTQEAPPTPEEWAAFLELLALPFPGEPTFEFRTEDDELHDVR